MNNIISAIINLVNAPKIKLKHYAISHNRANNMGEAFEEYIKDLFAGCTDIDDTNERNNKLSEVFSYLGNQNNPPDAMLKEGDAIEIKKIESDNSSLALNSSYPKAKLFSNSEMLNKSCRICEDWKEKDMIYVVGVVKDEELKSMAMVYGVDYCAEQAVYERIKYTIKTGVQSIGDVGFSETNELGRVNKVDPLGITYLRVRGMWGIKNPFAVFDYIYNRNKDKKFNFMCIIGKEKFESFNNINELLEVETKNDLLKITDEKIKDPNNPAKLKEVKLITFSI